MNDVISNSTFNPRTELKAFTHLHHNVENGVLNLGPFHGTKLHKKIIVKTRLWPNHKVGDAMT